MNKESCCMCNGTGQVPDYGPFGMDFYGPKECKDCKGTGSVRVYKVRKHSEGGQGNASVDSKS